MSFSLIRPYLDSSLKGAGAGLLVSAITDAFETQSTIKMCAKLGAITIIASTTLSCLAKFSGRTNVVSFLNTLNLVAGYAGVGLKVLTIGCRLFFKDEKKEYVPILKASIKDLAMNTLLGIGGVASITIAN
jgi:hypothetical protein